jgi:hypothetical protein
MKSVRIRRARFMAWFAFQFGAEDAALEWIEMAR